jgi:hypothetical protein
MPFSYGDTLKADIASLDEGACNVGRGLVVVCRTGAFWLLMAMGGAPAFAQIVQLPTFHYFTIRTSVLAPDRGGAYLGGIRRSAYGRTSRGTPGLGKLPAAGRLFGSRATGAAAGTSGLSVGATIIDHDELDRATLAAAGGRSGREITDGKAGDISRGLKSAAGRRLLSVAEIRRQQAERNKARQREAARLYGLGQQAEKDGKQGAAKIFYRMAAKQADSELREQIAARLVALSTPSRK